MYTRATTTVLLLALCCAAPGVAAAQEETPIEPGNKLLLVLPDPKPTEYEVQVDVDGRIPLGRYGRTQVAGKTVPEALVGVRAFLGRFLKNTQAITLMRTERHRLVYVTGHVGRSGFVRVLPGENAWAAIQASGGPRPGAVLRRVTLARGGEEQVIDVSAFLTERRALPPLSPGDTLFVPADGTHTGAGDSVRAAFLSEDAVRNKVFVLGAVRSPGTFERENVVSPLTAVGLAGGPTNNADLASVRMLTAQGSVLVNLVERLMGRGAATPIPNDDGGVILYVPERPGGSLDPLSRFVEVVGAVGRPGRQLVQGPLSLLAAVNLAGGPTAEAEMDEITLVRTGPGYTLVTQHDLERFLAEGGLAGQVVVHPGDAVHVGQPNYAVWDGVLKFVSDVAIISAAVVIFMSLTDDGGNQGAAVGAGASAGGAGQ